MPRNRRGACKRHFRIFGGNVLKREKKNICYCSTSCNLYTVCVESSKLIYTFSNLTADWWMLKGELWYFFAKLFSVPFAISIFQMNFVCSFYTLFCKLILPTAHGISCGFIFVFSLLKSALPHAVLTQCKWWSCPLQTNIVELIILTKHLTSFSVKLKQRFPRGTEESSYVAASTTKQTSAPSEAIIV